MQPPRLPRPTVVTEPSQVTSLIDHLSSHSIIAVDTESNSLYAYQEQVCLIQFSVPGADYLVDPLSELDLRPLGQVFANGAVEKVFHAAEYDVMCLRRDYGWTFAHLFDTMWAARVLGWPHSGLGHILLERFGVPLDKRWQRHNWGQRPLSHEALDYARLDTHYLLPLRDQMLAEMKEKGRLEEAQEFFADVAQARPNFKPFDPDEDIWRVKGAWDLEPGARAALRELLIWRDAEARRQNRPVFKIVSDSTLIALAQARPRSSEQMHGIAEFKPYHQRRYAHRILEAVGKGIGANAPQPPPRPNRPPDKVLKRHEALRRWRKGIAERRGVDPDVIVSNAALWTLAQQAPRSAAELDALHVLGPWKQKAYGDELLALLRKRG